jgi:hypothetical protein
MKKKKKFWRYIGGTVAIELSDSDEEREPDDEKVEVERGKKVCRTCI